MHVRTLETWRYDAAGHRRPPEKISMPTWQDIEAAIRRLDQQERPILFLWASNDPDLQMTDERSERLEVMGGNGLYWLAGTCDGYFQRRFLNPSAGNEDVEVYGTQIEQGFGDEARHICRDLALVLRAARYYAEYDGFDPSVSWETGIA